MYRVEIALELDGRETSVVADSRDFAAWEDATGKPFGEFLPGTIDGETVHVDASKVSISEVYRLAYFAARRTGLVDCPLEEFRTRVVVGSIDSDAPDPTGPAQSAGSSSHSPSNRASRRASGRRRARGRS